MNQKFVKGDQEVDITGDEFKVFLRMNRPMPLTFIAQLVKQVRENKIILLPDAISVIVISKDGKVRSML